MKEVTHIMTVQFTTIAKGCDAHVDEFLRLKDTVSAAWLTDLQQVCHCDDMQLVKDQVFVRDMED